MKHDFRQEPSGDAADRFLSWLERETVTALQRAYGDADATKAAIFLYANRAYEAHMLEEQIGGLFGTCLFRAGFPEENENGAFDWLEFYAQVAEGTHGDAQADCG